MVDAKLPKSQERCDHGSTFLHFPGGIGRPELHLAQELLFYWVWSSGAKGILRWRRFAWIGA
ncbi:hypothetical protein N7E02_17735 [Aliirhizobium terrae]|uniref:hypothetical protein n=1 Tax=Terrirhizobium terrae TaxID=2926709 RepID=UPI0025781D63|nr:hypothetical protein [Rhizobium sp. CC-CFT758]WJH42035.1 hypothetical protein N7E02_17735 [Rhizobium sp. CC-CFT758]